MTARVALIGAGGHAKVALTTLRAAGYEVYGVYDDDGSHWGSSLLGAPIRGAVEQASECDQAVIAIGDNRARSAVASQLSMQWLTVVHPSAVVHETVRLGAGTVVFAGAVVQVDTAMGVHGIVNTGATIDHDCQIAAHVHVAPGCHLSGGVTLGEGVLMGVGSSAIPLASVGAWAIVGAGAAVVHPIPAHATAVGVPAKAKRP